jgi:hypothetical protein
VVSVDLMDIHRLCLALAADTKLKPSAVRVGVALVGFLNRKTGRCDPSLARLGEAAHMKRSATWDAITALEKAGWITAKGAGGRARGNAYAFAFERLKPSANADGIDPQNHPDPRTKRSGIADPNPKEKPSLPNGKERGHALARVRPPGGRPGGRRRGKGPSPSELAARVTEQALEVGQ